MDRRDEGIVTRIVAISSLLLAACSGSSSGMTTIESTVLGFAPPATLPAFSSALVAQCHNQTSYAVDMVIGETAAGCGNLGLPRAVPFQQVHVGIANGAVPLTAGTYPIAFSGTAGGLGAALTAAASDGPFHLRTWRANSGTLTIDTVDGDAMSGSFEATDIVETTTDPAGTPVNGGTLTGRFSATGCHEAPVVCF
jgi:hypothetical protein